MSMRDPSNSKSLPKSSTERARDFRERKRNEGGTATAMMLSTRAKASIEIIRSVQGTVSIVSSVETALFNEAKRLCPTGEDVNRLSAKGLLTRKIAKIWLQELDAFQEKPQAVESPSL